MFFAHAKGYEYSDFVDEERGDGEKVGCMTGTGF